MPDDQIEADDGVTPSPRDAEGFLRGPVKRRAAIRPNCRTPERWSPCRRRRPAGLTINSGDRGIFSVTAWAAPVSSVSTRTTRKDTHRQHRAESAIPRAEFLGQLAEYGRGDARGDPYQSAEHQQQNSSLDVAASRVRISRIGRLRVGIIPCLAPNAASSFLETLVQSRRAGRASRRPGMRANSSAVEVFLGGARSGHSGIRTESVGAGRASAGRVPRYGPQWAPRVTARDA